MSEKSMLSTLQQAASNLLEDSQEASPEIFVGPTPLNRKAREKQQEFIETKTTRLQQHIEGLEAQIQEQITASDAELVQTRAAQSLLRDEIEQQQAHASQRETDVVKTLKSMCDTRDEIQKLEAELTRLQGLLERHEAARQEADEAVQALKRKLAASFSDEKTIAGKREPQIEYLRKQQDKYKRRLGGHTMRTAHLKGE